MNPSADDAVQEAAERARNNRAHRRFTRFAIVGLIGGLLLFGTAAALVADNASLNHQISGLISQVGSLSSQQATAADGEQKLAQQVSNLGAKPVVTPAVPVTGSQGIPGPGPTQAEIEAAVSSYFDSHPLPPGQLPPITEVAGLVAQYLQANPPAAGQNATPQMVSDAVTGYCAGHNGCAGPAGQDATDQQVAQQVSAYCATHGNCAGAAGQNGATGAPGAPGPQGASITDLVFQRDTTGTCQAIVTLHDPATGTDNTVSHPAGDAACPLIAAPHTK